MMYEQLCVEDFHNEFKLMINKTPCIPDKDEQKLRIDLIEEELTELQEAFEKRDVENVAKEIGDLLYVVLGCAVTCGINLEPIFHEIHKSNMSKKGGHKAENGKWMKPVTYEPAKILPILERLGYKHE